MFDDLSAYFYENALTAYLQYKEAREKPVAGQSTDLRLAINAATALYHLREHLPPNNTETRRSLSILCPDYDLIGDIVNASKHQVLTRGTPQVVSAESIYEEVVCTEYRDDKGKYITNEKFVMVELVDGSKRDIFEILTNVINMWFSKLHDIGIISDKKQFALPKHTIPQRSTENGVPRLDLKILKGVRFTQRFKIQKYNYDTGEVEPIDLTEYNIEGKIYKPSHIIDYKLINNKTGEEIVREVKLSEEQNKEYLTLKSDDDIRAFIQRIAKEQGVYQDIVREIQEQQQTDK